jgi:hypothetical protein
MEDVMSDEVSAEEAQGIIEKSADMPERFLPKRLARTVVALHARLDAVTAERDGLREDHRAASNACASATLRAGFFADIVHGVVRVIEPRDGEATVDAAKRVVSELAVLRAQLPPLLAVHDALVAAAALPGAGASGEEMVAAVLRKGVGDGMGILWTAIAGVVRMLGTDDGIAMLLRVLEEHRSGREVTLTMDVTTKDDAEVSCG